MVFIRAFSLLSVALAGFLAGSPRSISRTYTSGDLHILRLASAGLSHQHPAQMLRWLRHQPAVRSTEWVAASHTLDVTFRDGFNSAILSRSLGTVAVPHQSVFRTMSRSYAPGARALVLEPFASQLGLSQTANVEVSDLQSAGFQVDQAANTAVTVATMANLSHYSVIYVHTHSGVAPGGEGILATGEFANSDPAVAPLVNKGDVLVVGVSGSSQLYYAIASGYIRDEEGQFPADALFFGNGCNLLDAPRFWQALSSKGVGALISWNFEASSQDNYLTGAAFFHEMGQGMSVAQAIQAEQAAGYGVSSVSGVPAKLGFLGDGTITLHDVLNSPAPAATASVTATAVPPTPTATSGPTPTATATGVGPPPPPPITVITPTSGVPLSAVMKQLIGPGGRQYITAHSTPNTIIHFRVDYPNGDHQSAKRTTGPHGIAIYTYRQGSSKITRTNLVVGVMIEVGSSARHTSILETYRLRLGTLDLSVQPRTPVTGSKVHVWVHTRPHTRVMITLKLAKRSIASFWTKTGSAGWAHPSRRIDGPLALAGSRVMVVGRASFGGRSLTSRTFFTVR